MKYGYIIQFDILYALIAFLKYVLEELKIILFGLQTIL